MGLSNDQIQSLVKSRPSQREIQKGIAHQRRLRFHSDTLLEKRDLNQAYYDFIRWIESESPEILHPDKMGIFKKLIHPPIPTIDLTETIFTKLRNIFHSQDSFYGCDFVSPEIKSDWDAYRDKSFWPTKGFQAMQTSIDSVWIAALPEKQKGFYPEPYNRLIDIEDVLDIKNDDYLNCKYVIFKYGGYVYVYDDEMIRVYSYDKNKMGTVPEKEIIHTLDYTPARQFWSECLHTGNNINRESPITKELTDLDWLLFHMTSKKYMDIANAYPIMVTYEDGDDYNDDTRTENKDRTPQQKRSGASEIKGAGSIIYAPVPVDTSDVDLMRYDPVKLVSPDVETLEWHVKEETRLNNKIYRSVVGGDSETKNDAAKNEKQIDSAFESQIAVLHRVKSNFEIIHRFADSTLAKIRYGSYFLGCNVDYGTRFFLKDVNELHEDYKHAKESGASEVILEGIQETITNTRYRGDTHSQQRAKIINDLDPLPNRTVDETIKILEKEGIDKINFVIKTNLIKFVRRFEMENIPLVDFASKIDYKSKIEIILNEFKRYASEINSSQQRSTGTD